MILSTIMNIHSFVFKKDDLFRIFIQYFIRHFLLEYSLDTPNLFQS